MPASASANMRSRCGSCTMRPASSRTGVTIAHFRAREQPLILRVIVGNGVEQVDIFDRRQPLDVEIAKPPEMQAVCPSWGELRGRASPLHIAFADGTIGEMCMPAMPWPRPVPADCHYDAPDGAREAGLVEHRAELPAA